MLILKVFHSALRRDKGTEYVRADIERSISGDRREIPPHHRFDEHLGSINDVMGRHGVLDQLHAFCRELECIDERLAAGLPIDLCKDRPGTPKINRSTSVQTAFPE